MDNNRTRAIMNSIKLLIHASFPEADMNRMRLLRCFPKYRAPMVLLRKSTDLDDDDIQTFLRHIDGWFNDWIQVYGREGCTNYTHMLSSSHVMKYMEEWQCLHRFSQQGWEALNALVKAYFFRRTNRGGLSKNGTKKSKLLWIARWLQRRIVWYSSEGDALFLSNDGADCGYSSSDDSDEDDNSTTLTGRHHDDDNDGIYFTELEDDFLASSDEDDADDLSTEGIHENMDAPVP